jgi:tetratricopeptide (TPR) repeat protein
MAFNLKMENYIIRSVTLRDFTLDYTLSQSGMISPGQVSLSIGDILLSLKRLLPFAKSPRTLSTSLQDYGTKIILVASLANGSQSILTWQVSSKENYSKEEIPQLIEELAYQMAYSISDPQFGSARTWQTFANITQGLEAYQAYKSTNNLAQLELVKQMALNAHKCEPKYNGSSNLMVAVGKEYMLLGNITQAEFIFNEATQANPNNTIAWCNKGAALGILKKHTEAVQALDKAIELNPQYAGAWYNKGVALIYLDYLDKNGKAVQALDKAIELDPQYAEAWYNKGNALYYQGKYGDALEAYDKTIDINPQDIEAWIAKRTTLKKLGRTTEENAAFARAKELGYIG